MLPTFLVCLLWFESTHAIFSAGYFQHCREFFYERTPPQLFTRRKTEICLCQKYNDANYFATLYDTSMKIPLYSAYRVLNENVRTNNKNRNWRMYKGLEKDDQATLDDYKNKLKEKKLNRGHLATRFYFPTADGRKASDVLTNIAPQYEKFNQLTWSRLEQGIFDASKADCNNYGGVSYFLTGVIPSDNHKLNEKINIPAYFWTAVCCDTSRVRVEYKFKGWSFAYIVANVNTKQNIIEMFSVEDFLKHWRLNNRYRKLFKDIEVDNGHERRNVNNCLFDPEKSDEMINRIVTKNRKDLFVVHRPAYDLPVNRITFKDYLINTIKKMKETRG